MPLSLRFPSLAAAQAVYRTQLSRERLFVPTNSTVAPQTPVEVEVGIDETGGVLLLSGTVLSVLDAATAQQHSLGSSGGLVLHVPLVEAIKAPLRALLTGELRAAPVADAPKDAAPGLAPANSGARTSRTQSTVSPEEIGPLVAEYLEKTQSGNYYDRLQLPSNAPPDAIRTSYLKLMRLFHPDNYFKRIDDSVLAKLEIAYQQVSTAFDTLIDPRSRDKYDIDIGNFGDGGSGAEVKKKRAELEEYKAKNAPRIRKAKELWDAAMVDEKAGKIADAIGKLKLAQTFDPQNPAIPRKLQDLQKR